MFKIVQPYFGDPLLAGVQAVEPGSGAIALLYTGPATLCAEGCGRAVFGSDPALAKRADLQLVSAAGA